MLNLAFYFFQEAKELKEETREPIVIEPKVEFPDEAFHMVTQVDDTDMKYFVVGQNVNMR